MKSLTAGPDPVQNGLDIPDDALEARVEMAEGVRIERATGFGEEAFGERLDIIHLGVYGVRRLKEAL